MFKCVTMNISRQAGTNHKAQRETPPSLTRICCRGPLDKLILCDCFELELEQRCYSEAGSGYKENYNYSTVNITLESFIRECTAFIALIV